MRQCAGVGWVYSVEQVRAATEGSKREPGTKIFAKRGQVWNYPVNALESAFPHAGSDDLIKNKHGADRGSQGAQGYQKRPGGGYTAAVAGQDRRPSLMFASDVACWLV